MGSLEALLVRAVYLYIFILILRLILDYARLLNPHWTPKGFLLVISEAVFLVTDPPLRFLRKLLPEMRIGRVSFDLSFIVLIIGLQILLRIIL